MSATVGLFDAGQFNKVVFETTDIVHACRLDLGALDIDAFEGIRATFTDTTAAATVGHTSSVSSQKSDDVLTTDDFRTVPAVTGLDTVDVVSLELYKDIVKGITEDNCYISEIAATLKRLAAVPKMWSTGPSEIELLGVGATAAAGMWVKRDPKTQIK